MASSPPRSPHLSPAPLKRTRRTLEFSPINYMYQLSCPDGCISKSAAIRNYKLKESDFAILQPEKVVPNPHCPTKKAYWFQRTEIESYIVQRNKITSGATKAAAVATGGSSSRKQSSEVKSGTPSPVKTLRKKIQGFAFNTEDIGGVTLSTTLNSKEDKPPLRKKRRVTIANIEILDDGSVLDLPLEKV